MDVTAAFWDFVEDVAARHTSGDRMRKLASFETLSSATSAASISDAWLMLSASDDIPRPRSDAVAAQMPGGASWSPGGDCYVFSDIQSLLYGVRDILSLHGSTVLHEIRGRQVERVIQTILAYLDVASLSEDIETALSVDMFRRIV